MFYFIFSSISSVILTNCASQRNMSFYRSISISTFAKSLLYYKNVDSSYINNILDRLVVNKSYNL